MEAGAVSALGEHRIGLTTAGPGGFAFKPSSWAEQRPVRNRFQNRRQVASYTGMCPREDTSDQRRFQGSINKHDNRRLRCVLVEASWRLIQFQPTYKPVLRWKPMLTNPKTTKAKRKQIAVAIGRQFSVDWWRVRTGRCSAEELGLKAKPEPVVVKPIRRSPSAETTPTPKD